MKQKKSENTTIQSELEAARQRIQALEDQLVKKEELNQALREDHTFRAAVIEMASEGVCVCHDIPTYPFVKFTVWNQRMFEITGRTMEEINNQGWYQTLYPDPEVQERARERMECMREGDNLRFEHWVITRADGKKSLVAISTSILTAKDGSVHVLGLIHDFSEEERLRAEAMLARIDSLTGVKNRRGFFENAKLLFKLAARQTKPLTFAYLDVDNLKTINDTLGHSEGDQVLQAVGTMLLNKVRSTDVVGRLGGDEFAIVFLDLNASDRKKLFDSLHKQLLEMMRDRGWESAVSIGVVSFSDSIPDIQDVITHADATMYKAKMNGKGRLIYEEAVSLGQAPNNS